MHRTRGLAFARGRWLRTLGSPLEHRPLVITLRQALASGVDSLDGRDFLARETVSLVDQLIDSMIESRNLAF